MHAHLGPDDDAPPASVRRLTGKGGRLRAQSRTTDRARHDRSAARSRGGAEQFGRSRWKIGKGKRIACSDVGIVCCVCLYVYVYVLVSRRCCFVCSDGGSPSAGFLQTSSEDLEQHVPAGRGGAYLARRSNGCDDSRRLEVLSRQLGNNIKDQALVRTSKSWISKREAEISSKTKKLNLRDWR